ncbi:MAG: ABC transporter ATP-binding protein, partial [Jatrophihabitans sp.]
MTATLSVVGLRKAYGDVTALDGLDLEVAAGSFTAVVGPSGCGKSTLLSIVAGLLTADAGDVRLAGVPLTGVPAERRPVSLVFQKPLLFPHLTVAQNVGFGLRMRRTPKAEMRTRVADVLEQVQLTGLGDRRVGELSGGQEQRAALARALVLSPQLLLLDEPFSQLDAALRVEMRHLVRTLHDASGTTTVFVTHDQAEAVDVADEIALVLDGRCAGQGPPELFYRHPPSPAAARFFGAGNELSGTVRQGAFHGAGGLAVATGVADGPALLVVRPEALRLVDGPDGLPGRLASATFAGTH